MIVAPYSEYRDSGLRWLGAIPAHWELVRTKHLFSERVEKGFPDEPLLAATQTKGVVPKEQYENRTVVASKDLHLLKLVEKGDYVISLRSFQGGIEYAHVRGIISPAYTILKPSINANSEFFRFFFKSRSFVDALTLFVTGIRQGQNIDYSRLSREPIPVPSREEQLKIGRFLHHFVEKINRLIRSKLDLSRLLNERKQAIVHRTVSRGLDPSVRLKPSGVDWLGDVPEHWEASVIKHLARRGVKTFTDGDWIETPFITDHGVRLIQTGNIGIGTFKEKGFRYISKQTFEDLKCTLVDPGDVLICRLDGPVGRACLAPTLKTTMITSVDNTILKVHSGIDPRHVVYIMSSPTWLSWLETISRAGGGFRYRVSRRMLGQIKIPTPPLWEQRLIANHLDHEASKLDKIKVNLNASIEQLREYRTQFINDVVTGKLDVRSVELPAIDDVEELEPFDSAVDIEPDTLDETEELAYAND